MFSYITLESRAPEDHPLRQLRPLVDDLLASMDAEFQAVYSHTGRPSTPPAQLLRALLLQILYTVRSERLLVEQLDYNLLFRWFVGLQMDDAVWDRTVFSANRDRLLSTQMARAFVQRALYLAEWQQLTSDEHFIMVTGQVRPMSSEVEVMQRFEAQWGIAKRRMAIRRLDFGCRTLRSTVQHGFFR